MLSPSGKVGSYTDVSPAFYKAGELSMNLFSSIVVSESIMPHASSLRSAPKSTETILVIEGIT